MGGMQACVSYSSVGRACGCYPQGRRFEPGWERSLPFCHAPRHTQLTQISATSNTLLHTTTAPRSLPARSHTLPDTCITSTTPLLATPQSLPTTHTYRRHFRLHSTQLSPPHFLLSALALTSALPPSFYDHNRRRQSTSQSLPVWVGDGMGWVMSRSSCLYSHEPTQTRLATSCLCR